MKILCMRGLLVALMVTGTAPAAWAQPLVMNFPPDFGTHSVGELQLSLPASGGNGIYTWEVVTLPSSLARRRARAPTPAKRWGTRMFFLRDFVRFVVV